MKTRFSDREKKILLCLLQEEEMLKLIQKVDADRKYSSLSGWKLYVVEAVEIVENYYSLSETRRGSINRTLRGLEDIGLIFKKNFKMKEYSPWLYLTKLGEEKAREIRSEIVEYFHEWGQYV